MTVQEHRQKVKAALEAAAETMAMCPPEDFAEVIEGLQKDMLLSSGQPGLSQEQQVAALGLLESMLDEQIETFPAYIERIRAAMVEQANVFMLGLVEALAEAKVSVHDAKVLAESRDFDAHQESKAALRAQVESIEFDEIVAGLESE